MGCAQSNEFDHAAQLMNDDHEYSVEVSKGIWRDAAHKDELMTIIPGTDDAATLWELFNFYVRSRPDSQMYGERVPLGGDKFGEFEFDSPLEFSKKVSKLIGGMRKDLSFLKPKSKVGVYARNCRDYVCMLQACWNQNWTVVPIYDTFGAESVKYVLEHSEIEAIFCLPEKLNKLESYIQESDSQVQAIVIMDSLAKGVAAAEKESKSDKKEIVVSMDDATTGPVPTFDMSALMEEGEEYDLTKGVATADDWAFIMYSSGTTGTPKGVIQTHKMMIAATAGFRVRLAKLVTDNQPEIVSFLSYLPLAHAYENVVQLFVLSCGGCVGFFSGNIRKIVDDLQVLKPLAMVGVPRVFQRMETVIRQKFAAKGPVSRALIGHAIGKSINAARKGKKHSSVWDKLVFKKVQAAFGGRLKIMVSGSAPIAPTLIEFMRVCCGVIFVEGYGLTETAASHAVMDPIDQTVGSIGATVACGETRLDDVPELGYTNDDKPSPRGELCIRGPHVFPGYYKNPEMTAEAIDSDGWFHTGDIARINPNGTLSIIDRKKNIFKLAQGEYIAVEKLENVFVCSQLVGQSFVYGDSFKSQLVSIVTPDPVFFMPVCEKAGLNCGKFGTEGWNERFVALCAKPEAKKIMMDELERCANDAKLMRFEFVKAVHLEGDVNEINQGFNVENDLLTATFKLKRHNLKKYYKEQIDSLYESLGQ
eukprot:TRINITY_DN2918_c0_g2_i4.p1 TRINITY_DN2918_c0_g2~~TRINITY_DN2918_c0_g2_i4.p1  ORF type:complete len:702 (-),score=263.50 TRINITY_DN2918_c0_g2_i4:509-2614(-)